MDYQLSDWLIAFKKIKFNFILIIFKIKDCLESIDLRTIIIYCWKLNMDSEFRTNSNQIKLNVKAHLSSSLAYNIEIVFDLLNILIKYECIFFITFAIYFKASNHLNLSYLQRVLLIHLQMSLLIPLKLTEKLICLSEFAFELSSSFKHQFINLKYLWFQVVPFPLNMNIPSKLMQYKRANLLLTSKSFHFS